MKLTIAQLQERIKYLEQEKATWYEKYRDLKDADDKRKDMHNMKLNIEREERDKQVLNLLEIIRWQVNPKTAESPFMPTKNERDENRRNY